MSEQTEFDYEVGSGNVFADLELENADELFIRAQLGHSIRMILKKRNLKQQEVAELLGIGQSEVSKLMNGKYHLFSEGRLFSFLSKLDRKVVITITPRHGQEDLQQVIFS